LSAAAIAGVFVGGAGARMGGAAKGLLAAPEGGTILDRWVTLLGRAGVEVVLVGRHASYATSGLETLDDEPAGIGPLGGLVALLRRAGSGRTLALACDMPFVSPTLVARLLAAPPAPIVAPRREDRWEPLCARYEAGQVLPHALERVASGQYSLQRLLDVTGATALPLDPTETRELRDWDTPQDLKD
jgi:molybdopterin-guanine dinucleotide biosynthesis protein A